MDTLHIFVGTDKFQHAAGAERVLEHSIRKHATCDVDIHWMRAGDPDWPVSEAGKPAGTWNLGRPVDLAWPKKGTGTPFSPFRFAIPEVMGFEGRAVYFDADMLVLGDVAELLNHPMVSGYNCCHVKRTDVSVINCAWFRDKPWWPRISMMRPSGWRVFEYLQLLVPRNAVCDNLSWAWNDCVGQIFARSPGTVKLVHYTDVRVQPYRPYDCVSYPSRFPFHPNEPIGHLWWDTYRESLASEFGDAEAVRMVQEASRPKGE